MLLDGDIDFLAGLAWREDREEIIGYPDAAMGNETYNLVKHDADEDITVASSALEGRKIGVLDSAMAAVLQAYLEEHEVQAEIVLFRDYEPLFDAFDNHDIDVMAAEGDGAYGRAHAELLYAFGASDYYLCVAKSRPELLTELNEAQAELAANEPNYINSLRSRYYPVSVSSRAFSAIEKQWLSGHDKLRVGYLNHYLPYSDTDDSGDVTGIVRDVVPRMLEELGISHISVSFIGYDSYDGMISALSDGEIDTAFPVGGGLYYSEESGIFQSAPVVSAATELVHRGEYTEETTGKLRVLVQLMETLKEKKVIIYCKYKECQKALLSYLTEKGRKPYIPNGEVKDTERNRVITAINTGEVDTLITNIVRAYDVQDCDICILYSMDGNPQAMVQLFGRITREFDIRNKSLYFFVSEGREQALFENNIKNKASASLRFTQGSNFVLEHIAHCNLLDV